MTFINEKLLHPEASLLNEIVSLRYFTSTKNCVLTVHFNKNDLYPLYVPVKSIEQFQKLKKKRQKLIIYQWRDEFYEQ